MGRPQLPTDPRDPVRSLLAVVLILLVLGWFIWVLVNWPDSVVFR